MCSGAGLMIQAEPRSGPGARIRKAMRNHQPRSLGPGGWWSGLEHRLKGGVGQLELGISEPCAPSQPFAGGGQGLPGSQDPPSPQLREGSHTSLGPFPQFPSQSPYRPTLICCPLHPGPPDPLDIASAPFYSHPSPRPASIPHHSPKAHTSQLLLPDIPASLGPLKGPQTLFPSFPLPLPAPLPSLPLDPHSVLYPFPEPSIQGPSPLDPQIPSWPFPQPLTAPSPPWGGAPPLPLCAPALLPTPPPTAPRSPLLRPPSEPPPPSGAAVVWRQAAAAVLKL